MSFIKLLSCIGVVTSLVSTACEKAIAQPTCEPVQCYEEALDRLQVATESINRLREEMRAALVTQKDDFERLIQAEVTERSRSYSELAGMIAQLESSKLGKRFTPFNEVNGEIGGMKLGKHEACFLVGYTKFTHTLKCSCEVVQSQGVWNLIVIGTDVPAHCACQAGCVD